MTRLTASSVARAHGAFNVVSGVWPLLGIQSFEAVYGPKTDRWLVYTVAGLLTTVGVAQLKGRGGEQARLLGVGTATTLLSIDLIYVPRGRIRWTYLLDAACEVGWLAAWATARD